jgi:hypothetical protein
MIFVATSCGFWVADVGMLGGSGLVKRRVFGLVRMDLLRLSHHDDFGNFIPLLTWFRATFQQQYLFITFYFRHSLYRPLPGRSGFKPFDGFIEC